MQVKVSELTGHTLTWAVGLCETQANMDVSLVKNGKPGLWITALDPTLGLRELNYYDDWEQVGPIIEREEISINPHYSQGWSAYYQYRQNPGAFKSSYGPTPIIATMRCYVASKLGDKVEIPDVIR